MKLNLLILTPYPNDVAPSQRFRFEQYFSVLKENDYELTLESFLSEKEWARLYQKGHIIQKMLSVVLGVLRRFILMPTIPKYDLILIHRELAPIGPPIFEWFIAKIFRKKIIYDFDDAIWLPDPEERGSLLNHLKWKSKVASICKWSYKVSCGNEYLASFARNYNKKVIVNPTTIDTDKKHNPLLYYPLKGDKLTIGWTGSHSTLHYLLPIIPVIESLSSKYSIQLRIIANKKPNLDFNFIEFMPWNKESELENLMTFDIGIMPLTDDEWSKGKCGFKALQYMALNIPTCASPVGVNNSIIQNGINGFLCKSEQEWEKNLSALITFADMRKTIGKKGREIVESNYSVKSNTSNFLQLFN